MPRTPEGRSMTSPQPSWLIRLAAVILLAPMARADALYNATPLTIPNGL